MSGWLGVFCRVGVILDWDGSGAEIRAAQGGPDKSRAVAAVATPCAAWGWRAIAAGTAMARLERLQTDQQAARQRRADSAHERV